MQELLGYGISEYKDWLLPEFAEIHQQIISEIGTESSWDKELENFPQTLIHNDFNPRNLGFQNLPGAKGERFVAFDWELATVGLPQRDSVELLTFVAGNDIGDQEILEALEIHRQAFQKTAGIQVDRRAWSKGALVSLKEFIVHRLSLYFVANTLRECSFLAETYANAFRIHKLLEGELSGKSI